MTTIPDKRGRFGAFGGQYVPETLMPALLELEQAYADARKDRRFQAELISYLRRTWAGPPRSISPSA